LLRHEHAKHADRFQRVDNIRRHAARGIEFRGTRRELGDEFPDVGNEMFGQWLRCRARICKSVSGIPEDVTAVAWMRGERRTAAPIKPYRFSSTKLRARGGLFQESGQ
jgi:hypothetical protein